MSKVESGKKRLFIEDFIRLCELYNKPPEYLYSVFSKLRIKNSKRSA
ncbi:hypothetical protein LEP1GSC161_1360 [Leptospira santarosai str. CBC1416]|uniref:HTH cro/C1-type domain-containing protein n=4 Tax=Leptospira santarosai TaxID=28183 RepID=M6ULA3_9LEPT|nr:hypothetical protein LEP1GSC179_3195 [Leptospira santarosai str. MOR084]EKR93708.1 hypothetical protein LEP1GSC163_4052 [Leptospira santarosai str. CBC379]EMJ48893.1 hypothetical protein LEP1GSC169_1470 [Leptospira santarosai str. HAI1349]EMO45907.1 hypothetical protein LEP1GSC187_3560 [Leptospira santarosai str. ZUN179]EMO58400.1 hypothetical protein LEP1GSC161_1360 [Leptospira santarosai str. CBC1416]